MKMHDGLDVNGFRLNGIQNCIGKHSDKATANITHQDWPPLWSHLDALDGRVDRVDKAIAQAFLVLTMVKGRVFEFSPGLWVEPNPHPLRLFRISANTVSAGMVLTFLDRISSRRRMASAAQRPR
jgi:hypothetical protein